MTFRAIDCVKDTRSFICKVIVTIYHRYWLHQGTLKVLASFAGPNIHRPCLGHPCDAHKLGQVPSPPPAAWVHRHPPCTPFLHRAGNGSSTRSPQVRRLHPSERGSFGRFESPLGVPSGEWAPDLHRWQLYKSLAED